MKDPHPFLLLLYRGALVIYPLRLRFAYRVVKTLEKHDHAAVVQAWLTGLNPELNDRVPIRLLREGDLEKVGPEILGAVRAFVAGG